jgi:hypothetical protein
MRRVVVWTEENFTCLYVSYLYTTLLALLGNNTSQNGASCGQAFSNGNTMPIKHCVTSDLLSQQAFALLFGEGFMSACSHPCKGGRFSERCSDIMRLCIHACHACHAVTCRDACVQPITPGRNDSTYRFDNSTCRIDVGRVRGGLNFIRAYILFHVFSAFFIYTTTFSYASTSKYSN